ncbi:MAG: hypothetical protein JST06_04125 [Bacteroidetes bacterium]|nr:hypothetical protein [Bacteroidota bacterium]
MLITQAVFAQAQNVSIRILDKQSHAPVPFALYRIGSSDQGFMADIDGRISLPIAFKDSSAVLSALGYERLPIRSFRDSVFFLSPHSNTLQEAVVRPDDEKLWRILRQAIARRVKHNPDRLAGYTCRVYYKMITDVVPADSDALRDTAASAQAYREFTSRRHILLTETFSRRSYRRPQQIQEDIIASRFSGFREPLFNSLVTDILPFHGYDNYLRLNGRDFRNPLSPGAGAWYHFGLRDEMLLGKDTIWVISFRPRKPGDFLSGALYITSDDFALTHLVADWKDTSLGTHIRIEQHYVKTGGVWFPSELNYIVSLPLLANETTWPKGGYIMTMRGTSRIDSVRFGIPPRARFDKVHPLRLMPGAAHAGDSAWQAFRPSALDEKEQQTYVFMDSFMTSVRADRYLPFLEKITEGKIPIGPFDADLSRLYRYNSYEGSRYGLGLQTNERLNRHFSLGAWAGYGNRDAAWKWGGFAEVYFDAFKETKLNISFQHELQDPGRIQLNPELNRGYLLNYFIRYADKTDGWSLQFNKRFGYLSTGLELKQDWVRPQYNYQWQYDGSSGHDYSKTAAVLSLRYAYAEQRAPLFGRYLSTGSRYPIAYARIETGQVEIGGRDISYLQSAAAIAGQKHLARIGNERFLLEAGKIWSDAPVPLGLLFAARGIRNDHYPLYLFSGLQTLPPYQFMMDAFVNLSWRHDFDGRLYRADFGSFGSLPGLSLAWNAVWGSLSQPNAQQTFSFRIPEQSYQEAGLLLRDVLRMQYLHLCYIGMTIGYFYPLQTTDGKVGSFVVGAGISY